jgi:hypothetical protein
MLRKINYRIFPEGLPTLYEAKNLLILAVSTDYVSVFHFNGDQYEQKKADHTIFYFYIVRKGKPDCFLTTG